MKDIKNSIIKLPVSHGYRYEKVNKIVYCEASGNYTKVYLSNKEVFLLSKILKEIQKILPSEIFVRVSRKFLINLYHVKEYSHKNCLKILLSNGHEVLLSIKKKTEFLEKMEKLYY